MIEPDFDLNEADKLLLARGYTYYGPDKLFPERACRLFQRRAYEGAGKIFWNVTRWPSVQQHLPRVGYEIGMCYRTANDMGWVKIMFYTLNEKQILEHLSHYEGKLLEAYRATDGRPQE